MDLRQRLLFEELREHSVSDILSMGVSFAWTKVAYSGATLIRRPFHIRHRKGLLYGEGFTTGRNCRFEMFGKGRIVLGRNCRIGDNVHIVASERVEIGAECLFASKIFISDTSHGSLSSDGESPLIPPNDRCLVADPVKIGDNVWLGEAVAVMPGVTIGDGCVIGANATVTKDIPPYSVAVGSPARVIKQYDFDANEWASI